MKKIILCPFYFEKSLLSILRKDQAFFDVKFIDKETILNCYFGEFKKESVLYLIKHYDLSYSLAKTYLRYLPFLNGNEIEEEKSKLLLNIRKDLVANNFYKKDEYFLNLIKNQTVEIYGYSDKDSRFNKILDLLNCHYTYHKNEVRKLNLPLFNYDTHEDEVHALMINICDLLDKGVNINDIFVFGADADYECMISRFADLYHIPFNGYSNKKIASYDCGKDFFKLYFENHNLEETIKILDERYKNNENYLILKDKILTSRDDELSFEQQFDVYKNSLNVKVSATIFDNAVTLLNDVTYLENKYIFVIGFTQGSFPTVKIDNEFLGDNIKEKHYLLTTTKENIIAKNELLDFLYSDNHFIFSYANKVYFTIKYPSFLKDNLGLNIKKGEISKHDYSRIASQLELLKLKDLLYKYRETKPELLAYQNKVDFNYRDFDNQYKWFKSIDENKDITYSYSSLSTYIGCPFSYYLNNILHLDEFNPNFGAKLGTAFHAVLQQGLTDFTLSFEQLYEKNFANEFSSKEKMLCDNLKDEIKIALDTARKQYLQIREPQKYLEKNIIIKLAEKTYLKGFIDKMLISDNKFVTLIDYKTTDKQDFKDQYIEYGGSLQLPTYALLVKNSNEFKDLKIGGLFIHHVVPKKKQASLNDGEIPDYLKLVGKFLESPEYFTGMESKYLDNEINFINYKPVKNLNNFRKGTTFNDIILNNYIETTKNIYLECDKNIRQSHFKIEPMNKKGLEACKYCPFKDICFVKPEQERVIEDEAKEGKTDEVE